MRRTKHVEADSDFTDGAAFFRKTTHRYKEGKDVVVGPSRSALPPSQPQFPANQVPKEIMNVQPPPGHSIFMTAGHI